MVKKGAKNLPVIIRAYSPLYEHWHDDVNVLVRAHRAEDAGAGGISGLQGYLGLIEHAENVGEIFATEGNLGFSYVLLAG